jgi:hypothetical protein
MMNSEEDLQQPLVVADQLQRHDLYYNLRYLLQLMSAHTPNAAVPHLVNLAEWSRAANAYLALRSSWPQHSEGESEEALREFIGEAENVRTQLRPFHSGDRAQAFWRETLDAYSQSLARVSTKTLAFIDDIVKSHYSGINPWAPSTWQDSGSYLAHTSLDPCSTVIGTKGPHHPAQAIDDFPEDMIPVEARMGAKLGLWKLRACYDFRWSDHDFKSENWDYNGLPLGRETVYAKVTFIVRVIADLRPKTNWVVTTLEWTTPNRYVQDCYRTKDHQNLHWRHEVDPVPVDGWDTAVRFWQDTIRKDPRKELPEPRKERRGILFLSSIKGPPTDGPDEDDGHVHVKAERKKADADALRAAFGDRLAAARNEILDLTASEVARAESHSPLTQEIAASIAERFKLQAYYQLLFPVATLADDRLHSLLFGRRGVSLGGGREVVEAYIAAQAASTDRPEPTVARVTEAEMAKLVTLGQQTRELIRQNAADNAQVLPLLEDTELKLGLHLKSPRQ